MPKKNKKEQPKRDFSQSDNSVWEKLLNDVVINPVEGQYQKNNSLVDSLKIVDQQTIKPASNISIVESEPNQSSIKLAETV